GGGEGWAGARFPGTDKWELPPATVVAPRRYLRERGWKAAVAAAIEAAVPDRNWQLRLRAAGGRVRRGRLLGNSGCATSKRGAPHIAHRRRRSDPDGICWCAARGERCAVVVPLLNAADI